MMAISRGFYTQVGGVDTLGASLHAPLAWQQGACVVWARIEPDATKFVASAPVTRTSPWVEPVHCKGM